MPPVTLLYLVAAVCAVAALFPHSARTTLLAIGLLCAVLPQLVATWPS